MRPNQDQVRARHNQTPVAAKPFPLGHTAAGVIRYLCHIKFNHHFQNKYLTASVVKIKAEFLLKKMKKKKCKFRMNTVFKYISLFFLPFSLKENSSKGNIFFFCKERKT